MRIISGKYKGRRFDPPSNITARPTTDFAKESLFNLINNRMDIEDTICLDLFAGTGSISYELVSRGCLQITSVEMSEKQLNYIRKMVAELKINNLRIIKSDVFRFIEHATPNMFHLIFADPPYQLQQIDTIPDLIIKNQLLKPDGLLIIEHGSKTNFKDHINFIEERNYGNVHFSFFQNNNQ